MLEARSAVASTLVCFTGLAIAYASLLPAFEGPDEPEHLAYVRAWSEAVLIGPDAAAPALPWGYEIIQPPLYYAVAGAWARVVRAGFPAAIVLNPMQNPRFPFLSHDPEDSPGAELRRDLLWHRSLSVLLGLATAWVLLKMGRRAFGDDGWAVTLWLALALLVPNTLQAFSTVSNDGLTLLLSTAGLAATLRLLRDPDPPGWDYAACGLLLGLAGVTKYMGALAIACAASVLLLDLAYRTDPARRVRGLALVAAVILLVGGSHLLYNAIVFGDPTLEGMRRDFFPAFVRPETASVGWTLGQVVKLTPMTFAVDLCWQTVRWPQLSHAVFWPWLAGSLFCLVRSARTLTAGRRAVPEDVLPLFALFWCLLFFWWVYRGWTNLQIRHVLSVWPLLMLASVQGVRVLAGLWPRARTALVVIPTVGLVLANLSLLTGFDDFRGPTERPDLDRDYHTYLYSHMRNKNRGAVYLLIGTHLIYDLEMARQAKDWPRVLKLIESEPAPAQFEAAIERLRVEVLDELGRAGPTPQS